MKSGERHQAGDASSGFTPGEKPDDEEDLFPYFNPSCFSGYTDGPKGFYMVYGDLFRRLGRQERDAYERRDDRHHDSLNVPEFGGSGAPWAQVQAFYDFWCNFASVKDFSWADQYHPSQAPNRQVRRAIEEENKKARREARKEFNDEVRALATWLKRRDRRVVEHSRLEAERKEREKKEAEERRKRRGE